MRNYIIYYFLAITLFSCNSIQENNGLSIKQTDKIIKMKLFRRVLHTGEDTIPDLTCYFTIENNKFFYYKNGKVQYEDSLIKSSSMYKFKNYNSQFLEFARSPHRLAINLMESDTAVLMKFYPEGDFEYFYYQKN
jgi:hypothetical protein